MVPLKSLAFSPTIRAPGPCILGGLLCVSLMMRFLLSAPPQKMCIRDSLQRAFRRRAGFFPGVYHLQFLNSPVLKFTPHDPDKGLTVVGLRLFLNDRGLAKAVIGLAKGRKSCLLYTSRCV